MRSFNELPDKPDSKYLKHKTREIVESVFWSNVTKTENCWIWTGYVSNFGYGRFFYWSTEWSAHRLSFLYSGQKLHGHLVLDHICRNRLCVNPEHLRQVPQRVNALSGIGITARNHAKTHCDYGHEFSGENLKVDPRTSARSCRICNNRRAAEWRERKKLALSSVHKSNE